MKKVYVDSNSHLIFEICLLKISRCPYCAKDITDFNRNRGLEELVSKTLNKSEEFDILCTLENKLLSLLIKSLFSYY